MTTDMSGIHPITVHLREAVEQIRLANYSVAGDDREVIELDDILTELALVMYRLPHLMRHVRLIVSRADADIYECDDGSVDPEDALQRAETCLDDAMERTKGTCQLLRGASFALGHLRIHDTSADSVW